MAARLQPDRDIPERAADLTSYPAGGAIVDLPNRDLTQAELEELAAAIAQQPEVWSRHVAFDGDQRVYVSLHRDAHVDVWVLCVPMVDGDPIEPSAEVPRGLVHELAGEGPQIL